MKSSKWNILLIIVLILGGTYFVISKYIFAEIPINTNEETTTIRTMKKATSDYVTSSELESAISYIQETYPFFDITGFQVDKVYTNSDKTKGYLSLVYYIGDIETNYVYKIYFNKKGYNKLDAPNVDIMNYEFTDEDSLKQKVVDFQSIKQEKLSFALAGKIIDSKEILDSDGNINLSNFKTKMKKSEEKYIYDYNTKKLTYRLIVYANESNNNTGTIYDITIE